MEIVFGIPYDMDEQIINQLNFFSIVTKYYICKCEKTASCMHVYEFLLEIKNWLLMKKEIMCKDNYQRFDKCWGELADCLI